MAVPLAPLDGDPIECQRSFPACALFKPCREFRPRRCRGICGGNLPTWHGGGQILAGEFGRVDVRSARGSSGIRSEPPVYEVPPPRCSKSRFSGPPCWTNLSTFSTCQLEKTEKPSHRRAVRPAAGSSRGEARPRKVCQMFGITASRCCQPGVRTQVAWLPSEDSNLDSRRQRPLSYH